MTRGDHRAGSPPIAVPWWQVGGTLLAGLFVAYLDRSNLSVVLPELAKDLGFAGESFASVSSWALSTFLIGYALANVLGGFLTRHLDPRTVVIWCVAIWSVATVAIGFAGSVTVLLLCRFILGLSEGVYWPQQSRFAQGWFPPSQRTRANSVIQYYGQYLALALGFLILTPIHDQFGWRTVFYLTGALGLILILPLYGRFLGRAQDAPYSDRATKPSSAPPRLGFAALGGRPILLLLFAHLAQGMLFWGVTLWIPLAVRSLGFTGWGQAIASASPYLAAVLLAVPMSMISDRTGRRVQVAAFGLILPGLLMLALPLAASGAAQLALIIAALGLYASSYSPNIWAIIQSRVEPEAVGAVAGLVNGIGAGLGGTIAGFLVGYLLERTGSYVPGFSALGAIVLGGGAALVAYDRLFRMADES